MRIFNNNAGKTQYFHRKPYIRMGVPVYVIEQNIAHIVTAKFKEFGQETAFLDLKRGQNAYFQL